MYIAAEIMNQETVRMQTNKRQDALIVEDRKKEGGSTYRDIITPVSTITANTKKNQRQRRNQHD